MHSIWQVALICLLLLHRADSHEYAATCYTSDSGLNMKIEDCNRALDNMLWDQSLNLDSVSRSVSAGYESCMVKIDKPRKVLPAKEHLRALISNVLEKCPSRGGVSNCPQGIVAQVFYSSPRNIKDINTPACSNSRCPFEAKDCWSAFQQVPLDDHQNFIPHGNLSAPAKFTQGDCTITLSTIGDTPFRPSYPSVRQKMKKIFKECDSGPGWVYSSEGTTGSIGDLRLTVQGSQCS